MSLHVIAQLRVFVSNADGGLQTQTSVEVRVAVASALMILLQFRMQASVA
jgi:hypothetical protein